MTKVCDKSCFLFAKILFPETDLMVLFSSAGSEGSSCWPRLANNVSSTTIEFAAEKLSVLVSEQIEAVCLALILPL